MARTGAGTLESRQQGGPETSSSSYGGKLYLRMVQFSGGRARRITFSVGYAAAFMMLPC